jgi:hypothetical protein
VCFCVRACVRVHVLAGGGVGGSDLVEAEALDEGRHLGQALGPASLVPRGMRRIEQQREDLTRRVHLRGRDPSELYAATIYIQKGEKDPRGQDPHETAKSSARKRSAWPRSKCKENKIYTAKIHMKRRKKTHVAKIHTKRRKQEPQREGLARRVYLRGLLEQVADQLPHPIVVAPHLLHQHREAHRRLGVAQAVVVADEDLPARTRAKM